MQKNEIKIDVVYQNASGNSLRRVFAIADLDQAHADAVMILPTGSELPLVQNKTSVIYEQVRGANEGTFNRVTLEAFSNWASSVATGYVSGTRKTAKLRTLLGPGGKLRKVLSGAAEPNPEYLEELDEAILELEH